MTDENWNKLFDSLPYFKKYKNHGYKVKAMNILQNKVFLNFILFYAHIGKILVKVVINSKRTRYCPQ